MQDKKIDDRTCVRRLSFKSPPFTDNFGTLHALLEERKTKGCPGLLGTALAISQATMGIVVAFGFLRIPT
jgi:hypothetical protein